MTFNLLASKAFRGALSGVIGAMVMGAAPAASASALPDGMVSLDTTDEYTVTRYRVARDETREVLRLESDAMTAEVWVSFANGAKATAIPVPGKMDSLVWGDSASVKSGAGQIEIRYFTQETSDGRRSCALFDADEAASMTVTTGFVCASLNAPLSHGRTLAFLKQLRVKGQQLV